MATGVCGGASFINTLAKFKNHLSIDASPFARVWRNCPQGVFPMGWRKFDDDFAFSSAYCFGSES